VNYPFKKSLLQLYTFFVSEMTPLLYFGASKNVLFALHCCVYNIIFMVDILVWMLEER